MLDQRIHPIFHVSKLEPFLPSDPHEFPGRQQYQAKPVAMTSDGQQLFDIQAVLDRRKYRKKIQYLIHLKGCSRREAQW